MNTPPWYAVARKALLAGLVAFTVAGGTILAALADDRITATEWVTIALALAGAIVGPTAVFGARNAETPRQQAARDEEALQRRLDSVDHLGKPDRDTRPDWWTEPQ